MTYLFGPILSRRLGRSLGIDLLPPKTCSMNCIYCECGKTTCLTSERKEWVPTADVISEIDAFFAQKTPPLDFVTFSGAGEPTLHTGIGTIIAHIKACEPGVKICLLTNSTPLVDPAVRHELFQLDRIVPSLDAVSSGAFRKITRPNPSVDPQKIVSALASFKREAPHVEMWLEIFIVPGVNDTDEEIQKLAEAVVQIRPDKVQLNALDRPGCVDWIQIPGPETVARFVAALSPLALVESVGKIKTLSATESTAVDNLDHRILNTCLRRPCTCADLVALFGLPETVLQSHLDTLLKVGKISASESEGRRFFTTLE